MQLKLVFGIIMLFPFSGAELNYSTEVAVTHVLLPGLLSVAVLLHFVHTNIKGFSFGGGYSHRVSLKSPEKSGLLEWTWTPTTNTCCSSSASL